LETTAATESGAAVAEAAVPVVTVTHRTEGAQARLVDQLAPSRDYLGRLVAFLAVLTCTFGNLAAYAQTNMKRLLAYSTIAHAGYMMMPIPAILVATGDNTAVAERAVGALAIYIAVYLFMNLGAFAIVAFLRNALWSEEIEDYAGLIRRCPLLVVCFALILFSLVGLPPLSGFIGKFAIFASLVDSYEVSVAAGRAQPYLIVLLVVGGLNTVISLFYYLRVVKIMTYDDLPADRRPFTFSAVSLQGAFICLVTAPTALLILNWNALNEWALAAARRLLA
jgi:NADH-quinone oxidoreductase subunit N